MVSGSVAATIYGEPRATMDVDIAVLLNTADKVKFAEAKRISVRNGKTRQRKLALCS